VWVVLPSPRLAARVTLLLPFVSYSRYHSIRPSPNLPSVGMFWTSVFGLAAFFISLAVLRVLRFFWRCATSPLHELPGPVSTSWLYGNVREFTEAGQSVLWDHWTEIYGNTFKFSTFFNVSPLSSFPVSGYVMVVLTVLTVFVCPRPLLCIPRIRAP